MGIEIVEVAVEDTLSESTIAGQQELDLAVRIAREAYTRPMVGIVRLGEGVRTRHANATDDILPNRRLWESNRD